MKVGLYLVSFVLLLSVVFCCGCRDAEAETPEVVLKLAHALPTAHPVHGGMVYLAERVAEKSEGRMRVEIFPNEQLGTEKECIEALQLGYLAMTKTSSAPIKATLTAAEVPVEHPAGASE